MQKIKEYLLTTIGIALTAIALEYFFFPADIAAGGVSGIGLVINKLIGLDTSIVVLVLNVFLFILAFLVLGKSFGAKSIYATIMLSVFVGTMNKINKRLLESDINSILIYGETPKEDRVDMINNFRNGGSYCFSSRCIYRWN